MKTQLFIRFRNVDGTYVIYKSPEFDAPVSLFDDNDEFDEFVEENVSCDMQASHSVELDKIVWEMFEPYDLKWTKKIEKRWKKKLGFDFPNWSTWTLIPTIEEAYR